MHLKIFATKNKEEFIVSNNSDTLIKTVRKITYFKTLKFINNCKNILNLINLKKKDLTFD